MFLLDYLLYLICSLIQSRSLTFNNIARSKNYNKTKHRLKYIFLKKFLLKYRLKRNGKMTQHINIHNDKTLQSHYITKPILKNYPKSKNSLKIRICSELN